MRIVSDDGPSGGAVTVEELTGHVAAMQGAAYRRLGIQGLRSESDGMAVEALIGESLEDDPLLRHAPGHVVRDAVDALERDNCHCAARALRESITAGRGVRP